ncbi:MAG TPA: polysaccharide biosynthesis/export family protein [Silvibacterium sp.]|nr:polysaccharide biosynthesis/export family protein [Silvibacterium sp.]
MARNSSSRTLLVLCVCAVSCAAQGQANAPQSQLAQTQETPSAQALQAPNIVIGPGDTLNVQVFDTPELSTEGSRVSPTGQVSLPVLGVIQVAGLNTDQAARRVESELRARGIMVDPRVTISVVEYATQGATLLGEVKVPGVYPTFGGRRLLDIIALAGGVASTAGKLVTIAHRDDPQHPVSIALVPNAEALGTQENPIILPGDTIMVGRAGIIYIMGAVNKPGGFLIDNNEHISLIQALTLAGGWTQTAGLSKARLIRKVPEGHKELMLDLKHVLNGQQSDISVENGDILYVPVSFGKNLAYRGMEAVIAAAQTAVVYSSSSGNL